MSSRNVLLVNTNRMRPAIGPLALEYIGAALRSAGWQVSLLDLCWAEEPAKDISSTLGSQRPAAVAVTFRNTDDCYYASGRSFVGILRDDIRQLQNTYDGPIIVGGCGFSTMPHLLLEHVGAEFGVRGDGEIAFLYLARIGGGSRGTGPRSNWSRSQILSSRRRP